MATTPTWELLLLHQGMPHFLPGMAHVCVCVSRDVAGLKLGGATGLQVFLYRYVYMFLFFLVTLLLA